MPTRRSIKVLAALLVTTSSLIVGGCHARFLERPPVLLLVARESGEVTLANAIPISQSIALTCHHVVERPVYVYRGDDQPVTVVLRGGESVPSFVGSLRNQAKVGEQELFVQWSAATRDWALIEAPDIGTNEALGATPLDIPRPGDDVVLASYRVDVETRTVWLEQERLPCAELTNLPAHLRDDLAALVAEPGRDFRGSSGCLGYVLENGRIVRAGMLVSMHPEEDATIVLLIRLPEEALAHVAARRADATSAIASETGPSADDR